MRPIPVTVSDFPTIRKNGQVYVDKTAYLHQLVTDPNVRYFFLSRPRRFGKSMMLSTLRAIFEGRRELFDGLAISKTDYDWAVHPVIHLNFGYCASEDYSAFMSSLPLEMERALGEAGYVYEKDIQPWDNFAHAIDWLYAHKGSPVVLVDEYDDPVAKTLAHVETANLVRGHLATIFGKVKDRSGKIHFLMITGVSKFTKMSIFSALSNLRDISFEDDYATICGFTEEELTEYYSDRMAAHASRMGLDLPAYRAELKRMYNGYRFGQLNKTTVYNPVSINWNLVDCGPFFQSYWADTGRPSMLMNYLKREEVLALEPERVMGVSATDFDVTDLSNIPLKGLLYQTGYLTIKDYNPYAERYTLGIPDEEVRKDFAVVMASVCAKKSVSWASSLGGALLCGEWPEFFKGLKSLYAGVAYGPKEARVCEFSYGRCLQFLLQGQGVECQPEVVQAEGRSDMVCTHHCGIYIFELKVDQPAAIAMDQMKRKEYAMPYAADGRDIWLIGLSFDSQTRQLVDCAYEKYCL